MPHLGLGCGSACGWGHALSRRGLAAHALVAPAATSYEVGQQFSDCYAQHDGLRLLGYAIPDESPLPDNGLTEQVRINVPIQYFEKGRIEHQGYMGLSGEWEYTYGFLVPEMLGKVTSANNLNTDGEYTVYRYARPDLILRRMPYFFTKYIP